MYGEHWQKGVLPFISVGPYRSEIIGGVVLFQILILLNEKSTFSDVRIIVPISRVTSKNIFQMFSESKSEMDVRSALGMVSFRKQTKQR